MKVIEKITKEQKAKIPEYLDQYLKIGLSTDPCNKAKAEKAVADSYKYQKKEVPRFVWMDSPEKGAILAAMLAKGNRDVTMEEIKQQVSKASYGSFEAYWVSTYAFIAEQLPVNKDELIDIAKEIVMNCGVYWTFEDVVILTEKPVAIHFDKDKKLHSSDGLALEYRDGSGVFAINGKRYASLLDMTINTEMAVNNAG